MSTEPIVLEEVGQTHRPAFDSYPQFIEVPVPATILAKRAWQGFLRPFIDDEGARLVLRALDADQTVDIRAGEVTAPAETALMRPHEAEFRLQNCAIAFDVLILDFLAPAHPWAFSISPILSNLKYPLHPHLRTDRILALPSRLLHGMCVYSAAEFRYDPTVPRLPQFLNQVAIYLAKHVIWLKTQRLFNLVNGDMIHDGLNLQTLFKSIPRDSIWQKQPKLRTGWIGLWPGRVAISGKDHLSLDPDGECWCGKGITYKGCCLPADRQRYGLDALSEAEF